MKYLRIIILLMATSCVPSHPAYACQEENWYAKVESKYLWQQPYIEDYSFSKGAYSIETGVNINTEDNSYRFGISVYDVAEVTDRSKYSPRTVELFADKSWWYLDYYATIGVGYKAYQDTEVVHAENDRHVVITSHLDRATARFAIGRQVGNWEVAVVHHSNWMVGKPFNNRFEYHYTGVSIGYVFDLGEI